MVFRFPLFWHLGLCTDYRLKSLALFATRGARLADPFENDSWTDDNCPTKGTGGFVHGARNNQYAIISGNTPRTVLAKGRDQQYFSSITPQNPCYAYSDMLRHQYGVTAYLRTSSASSAGPHLG